MKAKIEALQRRTSEDQSIVKTVEPVVEPVNPEDDVELQTALAKVAAGTIVAAFRTRNGVLVETKGAAAEESQLHTLQRSIDR